MNGIIFNTHGSRPRKVAGDLTVGRPSVWGLLAGVLLFVYTPQDLLSAAAQAERQLVVVVLDLQPQNVPPGDAALMTDYLRDELVNSGDYQVVERQRMNEVIAEQDFQRLGVTQEEYAVRLGQLLNASKVFLGTSGMIQDVRVLTVRIVDVETGQVEASKRASGFSTRDTDEAMQRIVLVLRGLPAGSLTSNWPTDPSKAVSYLMVYAGGNIGSLLDYRAESVFKSGPVPGEPIWAGNAAEVNSAAWFPGLGLRLGAWKKWFGGDLEISALSHRTLAQSVFYDIKGFIRVVQPDSAFWFPVYIDTLDIPDRFQRTFSLGFGGNFYIHIPSKLVQPYVGISVALLMNRVTSDHPGPGNWALKLGGAPLNSTSLGWSIQLPIGIRVPISSSTFVYLEFRPARHFFSIISGDGFQRERDQFTLQTFQFLLGTGWMFR